MDFERKEITKDEERNILIGLITSSDFLKQIKKFFDPNLLSLSYARTVSKWCMEYFDQYQKAPFQDIKSIFETRKEEVMGGEEKIQIIETFLESISNKFEEEEGHYNVEYNIDLAEKYFKGASLELLETRMKGHRLRKDYDAADAELAKYRRVEKNVVEGLDVWSTNSEDIIKIIRNSEDTNVLFKFPGALGKIVRPFRRKDFVAFFGPAGRGKSWWLLEMALWASFNRLNVAFFSFEMQEEELSIREFQRITGQYVAYEGSAKEMMIDVPYFDNNYDLNGIVHQKETKKKALNVKDILKKITGIQSIIKSSKFKLVCAPAGSMKVSNVNTHLDNLAYYEDFYPDVVLVDYADLTAPERHNEKRHEIDQIWQDYRAISQARNCLVGTVSHTNKLTLARDVRPGDASEDIRKLAHLSHAMGLNQTDDENDKGIMRINILKDRFARAKKTSEAAVLQCLDIGQVYLDSRIVKRKEE